MKKSIALIFIVLFYYSCTYDKKEVGIPVVAAVCDTTGITFDGYIKPFIIMKYCAIPTCHVSGGGKGSPSSYETYTEMSSHFSVLHYRMFEDIATPMPPPGPSPKPDECEVKKIKAWIHKGFPEK